MKSKSFKILTLFIVLIFPFQIIFGQDSIVVYSQKTDLKTENRNQKIEERKVFVKKYVDSLNTYKVSENCELPYFFTTSDFDQKYGGQFMLNMHGRISLRKLIIDELDNYELMWCIMKSKDKTLQEKYTGRPKRFYLDYSKIPFEQFSTFELVDLRLDELENAKSLRNE
ncbi:hypothetical protein [Lacinutrix sp. MEBiC02595]